MLSSSVRRVVERSEVMQKKLQIGGRNPGVGKSSPASRVNRMKHNLSLRRYVTRERRIMSEGFDEPAPMYASAERFEKSEYTKVSGGGRDAKKEREALAADARAFLRGQVPLSTLKAVGAKQLSGASLRIWQRKVGDLENDIVKAGLEVAKDLKSQVLPDLEEEVQFPDWLTAYESLLRAAVYFQYEESNYDVPATASFSHWNSLIQDAQAQERQRNAAVNIWPNVTSSLHPASIQEHDMEQVSKANPNGLSWDQLMQTNAKFLSDAEKDFLVHGPIHSLFKDHTLELKRLSTYLDSIDQGTDAAFLAEDEAQRSSVIQAALHSRTQSLRHYVSLIELAESSMVRLYHIQKANADRAITLQTSETLLQSLLADPEPTPLVLDADASSALSDEAVSSHQASLAQFRESLPRLLPSAVPTNSADSTLVQFMPQSLSPEDYTVYKQLEQSLISLEADLTLLKSTDGPVVSPKGTPVPSINIDVAAGEGSAEARRAKTKETLKQFLTLLLNSDIPSSAVPSKALKAIISATVPLFKYSDAESEVTGTETAKKAKKSVSDFLRWTADEVKLVAQVVEIEESLGTGPGSLIDAKFRKILSPSMLADALYPLQPIEKAFLSQHTPISAAQVLTGAQEEVLESMDVIYADLDAAAIASLPPHIAQRVRPIPARFVVEVAQETTVEEDALGDVDAELAEMPLEDEEAIPFEADAEEIEDAIASKKRKVSPVKVDEPEEITTSEAISPATDAENVPVDPSVPVFRKSFKSKAKPGKEIDLVYYASNGAFGEELNLANTESYKIMMDQRRDIYNRLMAPHRKDQEVLEKMITFLNDSYDAYPAWFPRRLRSLSSLLEEYDEAMWMQKLGLDSPTSIDSQRILNASSKRTIASSMVNLAGVFGSTQQERDNVTQELIKQGVIASSSAILPKASALSGESLANPSFSSLQNIQSSTAHSTGKLSDQLPTDALAKEKLKTVFGSQLPQYLSILNKDLTATERLNANESEILALEEAREQAQKIMLWSDFSKDQTGSVVTPISSSFPSAFEHPTHQISLNDLMVNPHLRRVMKGLSAKIPNPENWPSTFLKMAGMVLPSKGENLDPIAESNPTKPFGMGREMYEEREIFVSPSEASHDASYHPYRHPSKGIGSTNTGVSIVGGDFGHKISEKDMEQLRKLLPDLAADLDVLASQGHEDPSVVQRQFVEEYISKNLRLESTHAEALDLAAKLFGPQRRAVSREERRRVHRTQEFLADLDERFREGSAIVPLYETPDTAVYKVSSGKKFVIPERDQDPTIRILSETKVGFDVITKTPLTSITYEDATRMRKFGDIDADELDSIMRINAMVSGQSHNSGSLGFSNKTFVIPNSMKDIEQAIKKDIAEYEAQVSGDEWLLAGVKRQYRATRDLHRKERLVDIRLAAIDQMIEDATFAELEPLMSVRHKQLLDKILASKIDATPSDSADQSAKSAVQGLYEQEKSSEQKSVLSRMNVLESRLSEILTSQEEEEFARLNMELQHKLDEQMEQKLLNQNLTPEDVQRQAYIQGLLEDIELYSRDLAKDAHEADLHMVEVDAAEKSFLSGMDSDFANPVAYQRRLFAATVLRGGNAWTRNMMLNIDNNELLRAIMRHDTTSTPRTATETHLRILLSLPVSIINAAIDQVVQAAKRATEGLAPLDAISSGYNHHPHLERLSSRIATIAKMDETSLGGKSPSDMTLSELLAQGERLIPSSSSSSGVSSSDSATSASAAVANVDALVQQADQSFVSRSSQLQDALHKKHTDEIEYNIEYGISQEEADAKKKLAPKPSYDMDYENALEEWEAVADDAALDRHLQEKLASSKVLSGDEGAQSYSKGSSLSFVTESSSDGVDVPSFSSPIERGTNGMIVKTDDLVMGSAEHHSNLIDSLVVSSSSTVSPVSSSSSSSSSSAPVRNADGSLSSVGLAKDVIDKSVLSKPSSTPSSFDDPMYGLDIDAPVMNEAIEQVLLEDAIAGKKVYGGDVSAKKESNLSKVELAYPKSEFDERYGEIVHELEVGEEVKAMHPILQMDASNFNEVANYIAQMPEYLMGENSAVVKSWEVAAEMEAEYPEEVKSSPLAPAASDYLELLKIHRENMKKVATTSVLDDMEEDKTISQALKQISSIDFQRKKAVESLFDPKNGQSVKTLLAMSQFGDIEETVKVGEQLLSIFNNPKSSQEVKDIVANTLHVISHPAFFAGDEKKATEVRHRLPLPKVANGSALTPEIQAIDEALNDPDGEVVQIMHYLVNKGQIPEEEKTAAMRLFEEVVARGPTEQRQYEAWMRSLLKKGDIARLSRELARLGLFKQKSYKEKMDKFNAWQKMMQDEMRSFNEVIQQALNVLRDPTYGGGIPSVALGERIAVHEAHLKTDWELLKEAGMTSKGEVAMDKNYLGISEKIGTSLESSTRTTSVDGKMLWTKAVGEDSSSLRYFVDPKTGWEYEVDLELKRALEANSRTPDQKLAYSISASTATAPGAANDALNALQTVIEDMSTEELKAIYDQSGAVEGSPVFGRTTQDLIDQEKYERYHLTSMRDQQPVDIYPPPRPHPLPGHSIDDPAVLKEYMLRQATLTNAGQIEPQTPLERQVVWRTPGADSGKSIMNAYHGMTELKVDPLPALGDNWTLADPNDTAVLHWTHFSRYQEGAIVLQINPSSFTHDGIHFEVERVLCILPEEGKLFLSEKVLNRFDVTPETGGDSDSWSNTQKLMDPQRELNRLLDSYDAETKADTVFPDFASAGEASSDSLIDPTLREMLQTHHRGELNVSTSDSEKNLELAKPSYPFIRQRVFDIPHNLLLSLKRVKWPAPQDPANQENKGTFYSSKEALIDGVTPLSELPGSTLPATDPDEHIQILNSWIQDATNRLKRAAQEQNNSL